MIPKYVVYFKTVLARECFRIGMDYTDYVPNENSNDGPTNQKRSRFNSEPPSEKKMDVDDLKPNLYKPGVRPSVSIDAVPEVNFILVGFYI